MNNLDLDIITWLADNTIKVLLANLYLYLLVSSISCTAPNQLYLVFLCQINWLIKLFLVKFIYEQAAKQC